MSIVFLMKGYWESFVDVLVVGNFLEMGGLVVDVIFFILELVVSSDLESLRDF